MQQVAQPLAVWIREAYYSPVAAVSVWRMDSTDYPLVSENSSFRELKRLIYDY